MAAAARLHIFIKSCTTGDGGERKEERNYRKSMHKKKVGENVKMEGNKCSVLNALT